MRTHQTIYSELDIARSQPPSLASGRDPKADRGGGKLYSGGREGRIWNALARGCCPGGFGDEFIRNRASYVIGLGSIFGFLLELRAKHRHQ